MRASVVAVAQWLCFEGSRKQEITLMFQRYVIRYIIVDAKPPKTTTTKRHQTDLVMAKIDLV